MPSRDTKTSQIAERQYERQAAAVVGDLVDAVCDHGCRLSAATKLLLFTSCAGQISVDAEFDALAAYHQLTPHSLLVYARENHADLVRVFTGITSLACQLGIGRLGLTEFPAGGTPQAHATQGATILYRAVWLLEAGVEGERPITVDLPPELQNRAARRERMAQARLVHEENPASAPHEPAAPLHSDHSLAPPGRPAWVSATSNKVLAVLFCLFLAAPLILSWWGWNGGALRENRNLAPFPNLWAEPVAKWPAKLEAFYSDRFGFRSGLVRLYNLVLRKHLRASNQDVVFGKEGWIFYARDEIFQDFFGKSLFREDELKRWKEYLETQQAMLARMNSRYLFVIAPDKNTIYPDKLPDYIQAHRGRSRLRQLLEYLRHSGSTVEILDLHDALMDAKSQGVLYFPQDTHWNGRGFFVAYQAMCEALKKWFPEIKPQVLGRDYAIHSRPWSGGEWNLFGLPEENIHYRSEFLVPMGTQKARKSTTAFPPQIPPILEPWNAPRYWEGPGAGSLLLFHDSYIGAGLDGDEIPLVEDFGRTLLVGRRPTNAEVKLIAGLFHPDVVIEERAERLLAAVPVRESGVQVAEVPAANQHSKLSECGEEIALGESEVPRIESYNARVEKRGSALVVTARNEDPFLILPRLQRPIEAVTINLTVPAPANMEVYAITDDGPGWSHQPMRVSLHPGRNRVVFPIPPGTVRVRIDPGDRKLTYTIDEIRYGSRCK